MNKREFINKWQSIEPNQPIKMQSIRYKHKGSTFDEDGIRILGSMDFIDSVLSRITDLLKYENGQTRLQVNFSQATCKDTGALLDSYKCYIQVHERGGQARMLNAMFNLN